MPTSPRDLAGGTGWYQPTALLSNPRADEGHRPLRERQDCAMQPGPDEYFRAPLHTRRKRGHPLQAGEGRGFPHPSRATPGPPSPEGKAASGGGLPSTCYVAYRVFLQGILPQAVTQLWKRGCGEGDIHKNTPQLFYKLWRNFLDFPGGSGGRAGEGDGQFASFCFFSSYIQVYPQSFPGFPQNLSTAVDTAVDKFKSLFGITCSGRHRWLRHPSYRHPWPG